MRLPNMRVCGARRFGWSVVCAFWAWSALATVSASGAQFFVDPHQSSISVFFAVTLDGQMIPLEPQMPGSLTAAIQGTVDLDLATAGEVAGQAHLRPIANPLPFEPFGQTADFAGRLALGPGAGEAILLAIRNSRLAATVPAATPIDATGQFSARGIRATFPEGTLDVFVPDLGAASLPLTTLELSANNQATTLAVIEPLATGGQKLTIPIFSRYRTSFLGLPATSGLDGQIVAYTVVPEPSSGHLVIGALAWLARWALQGGRGRRRSPTAS